MDDDGRIADVESIPADGTLLVTLRDGFDEREAILTRVDGDVRAWLNYCQHWTDVRLDRGSGATMRNGEILCEKHGATFEPGNGECTHGPCEGARLEPVDVTVEDGAVYLTDDYRFEHVGPATTVDRSSRGGLGF